MTMRQVGEAIEETQPASLVSPEYISLLENCLFIHQCGVNSSLHAFQMRVTHIKGKCNWFYVKT